MMLHVTLETDEEGWIVAECPALPLANIKEAIHAWLWAEDEKHLSDTPQSGRAPDLVTV